MVDGQCNFPISTYQFPDESKIVNETHVETSLIHCVQTGLCKQINIKVKD